MVDGVLDDYDNVVELAHTWHFLGLIVLEDTGVHYTNQTGGVSCAHPIAEGFFVPLVPVLPSADPMLDWWPMVDEEYRTDLVEEFLAGFGRPLQGVFEPWEDSEQLCGEAWIPVRISEDNEHPALRHLAGRKAILTYTNSD